MIENPRTGRTHRFLYRLAFCLMRSVALTPPAPSPPPPPSPAPSARGRQDEPAQACPVRGPSSPTRWRS